MGEAALRLRVHRANMSLASAGLVTGTFGNVSGADLDHGVMLIKPSGVPYEKLKPADLVPVSLETGAVLEGTLRPSSDTPTHLELYRAFKCGGVVHTHSPLATAFAQARRVIRCLGTTHADDFRGDVPVTRAMTRDEVETDYERNTGLVIIETFRSLGLSPDEVSAALVANHGPFVWSTDAEAAVEKATILEYLARLNLVTHQLTDRDVAPDSFLIDKHYLRKHGAGAYYGQS
jgi:L-ribulose-5-phosphate 4-epimerase